MFNYMPQLVLQELGICEYEERLKQAEQERYARQAMIGRPGPLRLLLAKVGKRLIRTSSRLQSRRQVATAQIE